VQSQEHHGLPPLRGVDAKMKLDPFSPIAPVRPNVLLLPVGRIRRSRFLKLTGRLQAENAVRLGDVSPDARPNRSMFGSLEISNKLLTLITQTCLLL
jgi:trafficking protein particle complex subunit 9